MAPPYECTKDSLETTKCPLQPVAIHRYSLERGTGSSRERQLAILNQEGQCLHVCKVWSRMSTPSLRHSESAPAGMSSSLSYNMGTALVAWEVVLVSVVVVLFCPSTVRRWFRVAYGTVISTSITSSKGRKILPPGPKGWPILGNLPLFRKGLESTLAELTRKYGGIVHLKLGSKPFVLVTSSTLARVVLRDQDSLFTGRPPAPLVFKQLTYFDGRIGPFANYSPPNKFHRKMMMQELLNQQKVMQFKHHRESEIGELVESIHYVISVTASLSEAERVITLRPFLRACVKNALSVYALGQRLMHLPGQVPDDPSLVPRPANSFAEDIDNISELLVSTMMIGDLFPTLGFLDSIFRKPLMKRLPKLFASMDAFLQQVVDQRRLLPREEARDVLDTLLSLRYTDEEGQKQPLTDWAVKFNLELVMLAGLDTISTVVEWVLAELLRHPYCIVKMQEEMDNVVGKHRPVEQGDLPNLPYLRAVVTEGMRLNPIGPLLQPRRCTKDTVVDGYHIAAETVVLIYVNAMQLDQAAWPDANQFRPERFLNSQGPDVTRGQDFRFMPFGSGRRICLGLNLAIAMVELVTARLVHSFNWSLPGVLKHRPQDLCMGRAGESSGLVVMLHPLQVVMTRRSAA